eukprot:scaffold12.g8086.t1
MHPNLPVIIEGAADGWAAMRDWVREDGSVNLDFLGAHFGGARLAVTDAAPRHGGAGPCTEMALADYLAWWQRRAAREEARQTAGQAPCESGSQQRAAPGRGGGGAGQQAATTGACRQEEEDGRLLYAKDWHCASEFPAYQAYTCPVYFGGGQLSDDWLNAFLDHKREQATQKQAVQEQAAREQAAREQAARAEGPAPQQGPADEPPGPLPPAAPPSVTTADYRFVYLGPGGTGTPLHADVLRTFSWSANIAGAKLWRLAPPAATPLLRAARRAGGALAHDFFADVEGLEGKHGEHGALPDAATAAAVFPGLPAARRVVVEAVQGPGSAIFVPSGWHHTVLNLSGAGGASPPLASGAGDGCAAVGPRACSREPFGAAGVLSINHNWFNGHNVHWVWGLLANEYAEAAEGIADCRELCTPVEFEGLVQRNLGANAGMDFEQFGELLRWVASDAAERLEAGWAAADAARADDAAMRLAFRLQRAGWALQRLMAVERSAQEQTAGTSSGSSRATSAPAAEAPSYAAEIEANAACLDLIRTALERLGLGYVL